MASGSTKVNEILNILSDQLTQGWLFYFTAKHISHAFEDKRINSSIYFFIASYNACLNETILAMSKLLIEHSDSISFYTLLKYAENNPNVFIFDRAKDVKIRVKEHKKKLDSYNQLINSIREQRDRKIAHLDKKHINQPSKILAMKPVDMIKVEECYQDIHQIINVYYKYALDSELYLENIEEDVEDDINFILTQINQ